MVWGFVWFSDLSNGSAFAYMQFRELGLVLLVALLLGDFRSNLKFGIYREGILIIYSVLCSTFV